ncbi:uncharacterized protein [Mytilus edulis]|uniref:uncharacterized protein n=1 Tax=Mytilus edulis TaxID=6550 RepID=UPI0039F0CFCD
MKMKSFVSVLCILFSGVFSKNALKRNEPEKNQKSNPLIWLILQQNEQLHALRARLVKLRDIAHENQKDMISLKRDMVALISRFGNFAIDRNDKSLDEISSKVIAVANRRRIDHLTTKLEKFDNRKLEKQIKKQVLSQMESFNSNRGNSGGGDTYVRWGRSTCPSKNGTKLVYSGHAGGGWYNHPGAPAEPVCLPTDPNFLQKSGSNNAFIYGMEYESDTLGTKAIDNDVPCSVCHVQLGTTIMIPGKTTCNKGWTLEYAGNLAAGAVSHPAPSTYVCIDLNPEYIHHGSANYNGKLLYDVVGQCGSLPCPPYHEAYPLTCAVCSK